VSNLKELFSSTKKESTVEIVINTIKKLLLTKKLKPGDRLPSEFELADSLNISRGSLREAMKILSAFGVVEIKRGDGTYIADSVNQDIFNPLLFQLIIMENDPGELFDLRQVIEQGVISLIIKNATESDITDIEKAYEKMKKEMADEQIQPEMSYQLDLEFHYALGRATRNPPIEKIYNFVLEFFADSIKETHSKEKNYALDLHKNILTAIKERDEKKAKAAIQESIIQWKENYFK